MASRANEAAAGRNEGAVAPDQSGRPICPDFQRPRYRKGGDDLAPLWPVQPRVGGRRFGEGRSSSQKRRFKIETDCAARSRKNQRGKKGNAAPLRRAFPSLFNDAAAERVEMGPRGQIRRL